MRMDSVRLVVPSACRPAKRTAVLTCAEGMGVLKSMAWSGPPWMVMGACPSTRSSFAPICAERLADALHRAEGQGVVADEGEGVRVRGDEAGEHAHGRAGVAAVERGGGLTEGAGDAGDLDDAGAAFAGVDDGGAERLHAGEGRVRVGAGGEVGEARRALGQTGQHGVTVRDGLVAGNDERALHATGGSYDLDGHSATILAKAWAGRRSGHWVAGKGPHLTAVGCRNAVSLFAGCEGKGLFTILPGLQTRAI